VRLSPDGGRILTLGGNKLTIDDLADDSRTLLPVRLHKPGSFGIWKPDGSEIVYESLDRYLFRIAADGNSSPIPIGRFEGHRHPYSWIGTDQVVYAELGDLEFSIRSIGLSASEPEPEPVLVREDFSDGLGGIAVSPDGSTMAYTSFAPGPEHNEVWVQTLPDGSPRKVSGGRGLNPMWAPDGRVLFFLRPNAGGNTHILRVDFENDDYTRPRPPVLIHDTDQMWVDALPYDIAADGRILMIARGAGAPARSIKVVHNWFEELEALVPVGR
jgi:hypothetical protein